MLATGVLIIASIGARWFLATSIPGDVELIQAATAVAAFTFLPFGQINRSTIVVDTFTQRLPERVRNGIDAFWDMAYAAAALILSWRLSVAAVRCDPQPYREHGDRPCRSDGSCWWAW